MLVKRLWTEKTDVGDADLSESGVDVVVEMENGELWTAHFVTLPYLRQQIEMSKAVAAGQTELGSVGFVALETPHVIVDDITAESIEDVVDNLMVLGNFEAVFDLVIDTPSPSEEI